MQGLMADEGQGKGLGAVPQLAPLLIIWGNLISATEPPPQPHPAWSVPTPTFTPSCLLLTSQALASGGAGVLDTTDGQG